MFLGGRKLNGLGGRIGRGFAILSGKGIPCLLGGFCMSNREDKIGRDRRDDSAHDQFVLAYPEAIGRIGCSTGDRRDKTRGWRREGGSGTRCGTINVPIEIIAHENVFKLKLPSQIVGGIEFEWDFGCGVDNNRGEITLICHEKQEG